MQFHEPVMVREVLERLMAEEPEVVCDGTLGSAGHARELIRSMPGRGVFLGLDRDPAMVERARKRIAEEGLEETGVKVLLRTARYEELPEILASENLKGADAVLLDIGTNSLQLEEADRGFSFSKEGPLDMRFNPAEGGTRSVASLVNNADEKDLADWIYGYGDDRLARRIARRIVQVRKDAPIETTTQLADLISGVYPAKLRHQKPHPATRTFQALRIVANEELSNVERGIRACIECLNPAGALCVISYHSGEERITKRLFDEHGTPKPDPANPYSATTEEGLDYRVESRSALKPREDEVAANPRARSARLRTIRRREVQS